VGSPGQIPNPAHVGRKATSGGPVPRCRCSGGDPRETPEPSGNRTGRAPVRVAGDPRPEDLRGGARGIRAALSKQEWSPRGRCHRGAPRREVDRGRDQARPRLHRPCRPEFPRGSRHRNERCRPVVCSARRARTRQPHVPSGRWSHRHVTCGARTVGNQTPAAAPPMGLGSRGRRAAHPAPGHPERAA